jgi:mannose-1-phosphate guanylyltransferase/mannose-1-phosphate guanylyltransferase/mannose-6-phosphate isomerase
MNDQGAFMPTAPRGTFDRLATGVEQSVREIIPVILAGGNGSRLWPMSRELCPKQLLPILGNRSLLKETVLSVCGQYGLGSPIIICNDLHRFLVAEQLREINVRPRAILLESAGRSTAPAIAAAAVAASMFDPQSLLLVLPTDHHVGMPAAFLSAVETARKAAEAGLLVAFGAQPDRPETGFGYMYRGAAVESMPGCFVINRFIEKPDRDTAAAYVESGAYLWNIGRFLFRADSYLAELERFEPGMLQACKDGVACATRDLDFIRLDSGAFERCPIRSIDHAVMERTRRATVVPVEMDWTDVGAWSTLWELGAKDAHENVLIGDVLAVGSEGSYVRGEGRLVATLGVKDLMIVALDDAVLVAPRDRAQDMRLLVDQLRVANRDELHSHRLVYRPWGSYQSVDTDDGFKVKRIMVKPGGRLSLQRHAYRAEHWVVVRGRARVTRDKDVMELRERESIDIPQGAVHRLENCGNETLHLIEVQTGDYLGEDDIVRLEDGYGRV